MGMEELGNRCSFRVKKFVRKQEIFVSIPSSLIYNKECTRRKQ